MRNVLSRQLIFKYTTLKECLQSITLCSSEFDRIALIFFLQIRKTGRENEGNIVIC